MSNHLKQFIVAIISFTCGVMATSFFNRSGLVDPVLSPRQKELQVIAVEAERRPFFPVASPVGNEIAEEASSKPIQHSEEAPAQEIDYQKITSQIKEFQNNLKQVGAKKFENVYLHERVHANKKDYLLNKMDYFRTSQKNWYKAEFSSPDLGSARFVFYMNFYDCGRSESSLDLPRKERSTLDNSCVILWSYIRLNGKWNFYSTSSNLLFTEWKNDMPFIPFSMEEMGEFPKETNILKAYIPATDGGGPISFLKYEGGKFEWIEPGDLSWVVTSSKEAEKFQKIVKGGGHRQEQ